MEQAFCSKPICNTLQIFTDLAHPTRRMRQCQDKLLKYFKIWLFPHQAGGKGSMIRNFKSLLFNDFIRYSQHHLATFKIFLPNFRRASLSPAHLILGVIKVIVGIMFRLELPNIIYL